MAAYLASFGIIELLVAGILTVGCLVTAVLIVKDVIKEVIHPSKSSVITEENFDKR